MNLTHLHQVFQYGLELLVPLSHLRARLQYRAGMRKNATSEAANAFSKLASVIADSRTLWRIWGDYLFQRSRFFTKGLISRIASNRAMANLSRTQPSANAKTIDY
jgi:hypothetical protein